MQPIRLVLAVAEEDYIEPFLHYIRCSEFERVMVVTAFSRREALWSYLANSPDKMDVILGESSFKEGWQGQLREGVPWIELSEGGHSEREAGCDLRVPKYQPLNLLLADVTEMVRGRRESSGSRGGARLIGVVSAAGGSGKTTLSIHLARQLASEGKRVIYISLEYLQSDISGDGREQVEGEGRPGLALLLYDLKVAEEKHKKPRHLIHHYVYSNSCLRCDAFPALHNLNEMKELDRGSIEALLDFIIDSSSYDAVIVDTDAIPDLRVETVMQRANQIIWVVGENPVILSKTTKWLSFLERANPGQYNEVMGKSLFVANRATGEGQLSLPGRNTLVSATLPWIPAWNGSTELTEGQRQAPAYQRDVMRLSRMLQEDWELREEGRVRHDRG